MMTKTDWPKEPLDSAAMAALEHVLKEWCVEHNCERGSAQAQIAAKALVDWFEFGVRSEVELAGLLRNESALELQPALK